MAGRNIPGIHNYCDRWCERCFFSSRCAVYEDTSNMKPDEKDLKNKAFWERLSHNFTKAKEMLEQTAEKVGVDLNAMQADLENAEKKTESIRKKSADHPIIQLTREYTEFGNRWLKTQPGMMDKLEHLKENLTLGVESQQEAKVQMETIKDCLAVIQWYLTFLEPKLMRALMGKADNEWTDDDGDVQHDYDGSAKVAIIGTERSTQAWIRLFDLLPEQEDDFLKALSLLEKIKGLTLAEFPKAMAFVRPGFDENAS
jgi:hypothetical protein